MLSKHIKSVKLTGMVRYTLFRYFISTVTFTLMLSITGCLYYEYSRENIVEEENIDAETLAKEAMEKAHDLSIELEQASEMLPKDHPLVKEANIALDSIIQLPRPQKNTSYYYDEYSQRYSMLELIDESSIRVNILADDEPLAQVFPNGKLYITSGLIDHDSPYAVKNQAQLIGVLAHEFSHLRDGDVLWQWVSIEARKREVIGKTLANITQLIPVIEYNYGSVVTYANLDQLDELIEYKSDMEAIKILERLNYDPREYANYIGRYRSILNRKKEKEDMELHEILRRRVMCMELYFSPQKAIFKYPRPTISYENKKLEVLPVFRVTNPKRLSDFEQYDLCAQANVLLSKQDRESLMDWLKQPRDRKLNDVMTSLSASGVKIIEIWMDKTMYKRFSLKF